MRLVAIRARWSLSDRRRAGARAICATAPARCRSARWRRTDVAEIVQAMGLDPIGQPVRSGPFYVQRATDDFGRVLRVTVDARRSQVIAIEAAAAPRAAATDAYAGYGAHRRPYPGYAVAPR